MERLRIHEETLEGKETEEEKQEVKREKQEVLVEAGREEGLLVKLEEETERAEEGEEDDAVSTLIKRLEREWEETLPTFRSRTCEDGRFKGVHHKQDLLPTSSLPAQQGHERNPSRTSLPTDSPALPSKPSLLKSPAPTPSKRNLSRIRRQSGAMGGGSGF
eukprot:259048-Hanusia_phi.AAC.4